MNNLQWITDWFSRHCDGDWEHEHQIVIETSDNPGWIIQIDLRNTDLEGIEIEYILNEVDDNNWFGFSIKNSKFHGVGDLTKLDLLLGEFKKMVLLHESPSTSNETE